MDQIATLLKEIGLTEYEAKAFIALLKYGALTAEKISDFGKIPLPRVYDTIGDLQNKGFVLASRGRPKIFKALPVEKSLNHFFDTQKKDLIEKIDSQRSVVSEIKKLASTLESKSAVREEKWNVWSIGRKGNIDRLLLELKENAKKEVCVFSGDLSWIRDEECARFYKSMIKNGIRFKVITGNSSTNKLTEENVKTAKKLGMKVKSGYTGSTRCNIIDRNIVALTSKTPKTSKEPNIGHPGTDSEFDYEITIINNKQIVHVFLETFDFWWNKLS